MGPALADLWCIDQRPQILPQARPEPLLAWPAPYLEALQTCAAGQPLGGSPWVTVLAEVAQASPEALLLVATPWLLLNVNRYGHRHSVVAQWAADLAVADGLRLAVTTYYRWLCGAFGQPTRRFGPGLPLDLASRPELGSPPADLAQNRPLGRCQALIQATQAQFWPTLELAQVLGWSEAAVGLAAVGAILTAGPTSLPRSLYARYGELTSWGQRWQHCNASQMEQWADRLYYRWAGVRPAAVPRIGTAYNG